MFGLGAQELLLILLIAPVFFFGGEKLPDIAKGWARVCGSSNAPARGRWTTRTSPQSAGNPP